MDARPRQQEFEAIRDSEFGFWLPKQSREVVDKLLDTDDVLTFSDVATLDEIQAVYQEASNG